MTKEEVISLAQITGLALYVNDVTKEPFIGVLTVFALLVAEHEREQCALVCEGISEQAAKDWKRTYHPLYQGQEEGAEQCSDAIRDRGLKP